MVRTYTLCTKCHAPAEFKVIQVRPRERREAVVCKHGHVEVKKEKK